MHSPARTSLMIFATAINGCGAPPSLEDPCATQRCEPWQQCVAGVCEPRDGHCAGDADCGEREGCSVDHTCQGPVVPDVAFLDPLAGSSVRFELRGLINPSDAIDPTPASGVVDVQLDGLSELMNGLLYATGITYPEDYPEPVLRGRDYIMLSENHELERTGPNTATYLVITGGIPADRLRALRELDERELPFGDDMWVVIYVMELTVRSWDGVQLLRYCPRGQAVAGPSSGLFVNPIPNAAFAPGEDLYLWGNLALQEIQISGGEQEEAACIFYQDQVAITRAQYVDALVAEAPTLSCGLPDGFFEAVAVPAVEVLFSGAIDDLEGEAALPVIGHATVHQDGVVSDVGRYQLYSYLYSLGQQELLVLQGMGLPTPITDQHYVYDQLTVAMDRATLNRWSQEDPIEFGVTSDQLWVTLERCEWATDGGHDYLKICPAGVLLPTTTNSRLRLCADADHRYETGDLLELAVALELATDPATIAQLYGSDACWCAVDAISNVVECSVFEAATGQGG